MDFYFKCTLYIVLHYLQRRLAAECVFRNSMSNSLLLWVSMMKSNMDGLCEWSWHVRLSFSFTYKTHKLSLPVIRQDFFSFLFKFENVQFSCQKQPACQDFYYSALSSNSLHIKVDMCEQALCNCIRNPCRFQMSLVLVKNWETALSCLWGGGL